MKIRKSCYEVQLDVRGVWWNVETLSDARQARRAVRAFRKTFFKSRYRVVKVSVIEQVTKI